MMRTDNLPPLAPQHKSMPTSASGSAFVDHDSENDSSMHSKFCGAQSAPCSPMKGWKSRDSEVDSGSGSEAVSPSHLSRSDSFHVIHKVPAGDTPYVRAKHVQLVDKDPDRAIALFWAAINAGDRVDSALKDMAIVMKQQNRSEEAIEAIKSLRVRCTEQAQESLDNVLLDLYKRCGRLDDQIALLKHKLQMIHQGTAFKGKRTKTARSQGKKIQVSIEQEATRLLGNLGWAYMQQNNYVAADAVYRKALSIEPDNNKVCNLGICLMKQGRLEEAKAMLLSVTPGGDSRWGSESHLKSFERAQEMLQEVEQQLKEQSQPCQADPMQQEQLPPVLDLAAIGIPDLWESIVNGNGSGTQQQQQQQQKPFSVQQAASKQSGPPARPPQMLPRAPQPFYEPSSFLPHNGRSHGPTHPPPRHPGLNPGHPGEAGCFRQDAPLTLEELALQYNSAAATQPPQRGLASGFTTPPVDDMEPAPEDSWFLAGRVSSSFSAPNSGPPVQPQAQMQPHARHDMAWHAYALRKRLETIQQQNSSHGNMWHDPTAPSNRYLHQQQGHPPLRSSAAHPMSAPLHPDGSNGLGLSSLRPEARPFVLPGHNPHMQQLMHDRLSFHSSTMAGMADEEYNSWQCLNRSQGDVMRHQVGGPGGQQQPQWGPSAGGPLRPLTSAQTNVAAGIGEEGSRWEDKIGNNYFSAMSLGNSSQKRNRVPTPVKKEEGRSQSGSNEGGHDKLYDAVLPDHLYDFDCVSSVVDSAIGAIGSFEEAGILKEHNGYGSSGGVTATLEIKRPRKVVLFQDMPGNGFA